MHCRDVPSVAEPLEMACSICFGAGCSRCDDGWIKITECPKDWIGGEFVVVMNMLKRFQHGHPIAAPCQLDETRWVLTASMIMEAENNQARERAENSNGEKIS